MVEKTNRIEFKQFSVRRLEFKANENCAISAEGSLHVRPNLFWTIGTAEEDPNEYCVILGCTMFKDEEQAPFEFRIETEGIFLAQEGIEQKRLEIFALTSLFPYLDGLISQSLAMVQKNQSIMAIVDIEQMVEKAERMDPKDTEGS